MKEVAEATHICVSAIPMDASRQGLRVVDEENALSVFQKLGERQNSTQYSEKFEGGTLEVGGAATAGNFSSRTRCTCLRARIMVLGTRGRHAGSRRCSDSGDFSSRTRCTCLRPRIMVFGTRGRYAGSRWRRDGGELLIPYPLYLSPSTHNGTRKEVRWK